MAVNPPGSWPGTSPDIEKSVSLDQGSDNWPTSTQLPEKTQYSDEIDSAIKGKGACQRSKRNSLPAEILKR